MRRRRSSTGNSRAARKAPAFEARVAIGEIGARGDGIGSLDNSRCVYVPYSAPGDLLEVAVTGERGKILEIVEPGGARAVPPCRHFGACGGCSLQHISGDFYRDWKRGLVVQSLAREGFAENIIRPLIECPPPSRRRVAFAVQRKKGADKFGFFRKNSHTIEPITECHILHPDLSEKLTTLKKFACETSTVFPEFTLVVTLCDNGLDVAIIGKSVSSDLPGNDYLLLTQAAQEPGILRLSIDDEPMVSFAAPRVQFGPLEITPPPAGFLQASREGEAALARLVIDAASGARRIADLFCGAGTFTGPLASLGSVDAFDLEGPAIEALDAGARGSSLPHAVRAMRRNLFQSPLLAADLKPYDAVVFDPPRAGAAAQASELAESAVPVVIGVSCNPQSFARDAAILRSGGYALQSVTPVDQFVYATHVELVGVFHKE